MFGAVMATWGRRPGLHGPGPGWGGGRPDFPLPTFVFRLSTLDLGSMADELIVGVDLGGTKVSVGAVARDRVLELHRRPISAGESEGTVLREVMEAIDVVMSDQVTGIGCGVPSIVDVDTGVVYDVENIPSWKEVPLKGLLEDRFGIPAAVNNDANAFVVGERAFGWGRGISNLVGITLGTGMGTGVIVDGRLYAGRNCCAGEIGSIPHKGLTIEDFCSGRFFHREAGIDGGVVWGRALDGDPEAIRLFERFGTELSFAVTVALYSYDPDAIVMGGSISEAFDLFQASMWSGLADFDYPHVVDRLVIRPSALEHSAVLGAAALYLETLRE